MTDTDQPPREQAVEPATDTEAAFESGSEPTQIENPVFADRARIAERFKAQREQRQGEQAEIAAQERIAGDVPADQQDAPRTIKVKVRHEIRELPENEVIAAAQ